MYRFRQYASSFPVLLHDYLRVEAIGSESAFTLVESALHWLRSNRVIVPALSTLAIADKKCLLTAILASATNLGKTKMADATEGYTVDRLAWVEDWYLREGTYARALAAVVQLQAQIPLAAQWGSGRTSSSDGHAFPIPFKKSAIANVNAKYGRDPVSMVYTHLSDRYAPFSCEGH